jgi:hypothetical protein
MHSPHIGNHHRAAAKIVTMSSADEPHFRCMVLLWLFFLLALLLNEAVLVLDRFNDRMIPLSSTHWSSENVQLDEGTNIIGAVRQSHRTSITYHLSKAFDDENEHRPTQQTEYEHDGTPSTIGEISVCTGAVSFGTQTMRYLAMDYDGTEIQ